MQSLKSFFYYLAIVFVIIALFSDEVEGRRKILRGRKTITRTYYRSTGIPAWAIVLLSGLGMIIISGIIFIILKKTMVDPLSRGQYNPPPLQNDV